MYQSIDSIDEYGDRLEDIRFQVENVEPEYGRNIREEISDASRSNVRQSTNIDRNTSTPGVRNLRYDDMNVFGNPDHRVTLSTGPVRRKHTLRRTIRSEDDLEEVLPSNQRLDEMIKEIDDATRNVIASSHVNKIPGISSRDYTRPMRTTRTLHIPSQSFDKSHGDTDRSGRNYEKLPESIIHQPTNDKSYFMKPPKFDGKGCIESHLMQFGIVASRNKWCEEEKVDYFKCSLTGDASHILKDVPDNISYQELINKLKQRYGSLDQIESFRVQLKARRRKPGESLSSLMQDIRRLFALAFPNPSGYMGDITAKDAFIDALEDRELMIRVLEREPKNLDEAFKITERMELYSKRTDNSEKTNYEQKTKGMNKVRVATANEDSTIQIIMDTQKAMQQQMSSMMEMIRQQKEQFEQAQQIQLKQIQQMSTIKSDSDKGKDSSYNDSKPAERKPPTCYCCGKQGHKSPVCPDKGIKQYVYNSRNRFYNQSKKDESDDKNSKPTEVRKIGRTLYIELGITGKKCQCLVDTGCEINLIPRRFLEEVEIQPSARTLQAANGTEIGVLGEVELEVDIGERRIPTKFIVTDQVSEILIGIEWLQEHKCNINFAKSIIDIHGKSIPLLKKVTRNTCNRIILQEDVEIPAETEMNVYGKIVYSDLSKSGRGPRITNPRECIPGIHVACTLLPERSLGLPVRIMNVKKVTQEMKKGDYLTEVQEIDGEITIEDESLAGKEEREEKIDQHIRKLIEEIDTEVPPEEKEQLDHLMNQYRDIISSDEYDLGRTSMIQHKIETGNSKPVRQTLRRTPLAHSYLIDEQLDLLTKQGIIQPTNSEYSSNVVLVRKKDSSWRFCIDFRKLNDLTVKDAYPLPRIDDCLDALAGSTWFSTLDMRSGYFQVEIDPKDAHKTAFVTKRGSFQFRVMPQGLCNAAATFQRLMHLVMAGLNYNACLVYLDDVIIFAPNLELHLKRLEEVFERFRSAGLKIRADKCHLLQKEVNFLGYRINEEGIGTDPRKIEAVISWPTPINLKELRSFVGLCAYYRRFVKDFAGVAEPLHALTRKDAVWRWTAECRYAFEELKRRLTTTPIMALPLDEGIYLLDCDASQHHIGCVLSLEIEGRERVIAYGSRLYSRAEMHYCVTRKELLAVVYFTKLFKQYLLGRHFIIRTDHAALKWLRKTPEPIGQQSRWLEQLEAFDYEVVHRPGVKHGNADALSRIPCKQCKMIDEDQEVINAIDEIVLLEDTTDFWDPIKLAELQKHDIALAEFYVMKSEKGNEKPPWESIKGCSDITKTLWTLWSEIIIEDGVMYRKVQKLEAMESQQVIIPICLRKGVVRMAHSGMTGGHLGIARTKDQVRRRAYWPGWSKFVERFCLSCHPCSRYRRGKPPRRGELNPIAVGMPFEILSLDITGPHPKSTKGFTYILTAMDHFSKFAFAFPLRNQEAGTIARILVDQVFGLIGMPRQILTDQGRNFESELFRELCKCLGIDKIRTSTYKPSTNGMLERFHRTLNSMLAKVINESQRNWDEMLQQVMAAYRSSVHATTGFSPNFIVFGQENRAPIDIVMGTIEKPLERNLSFNEFVANKQNQMTLAYEKVRNCLRKTAQRRKDYYDVKVKPTVYQPGDRVWYFYPRRYLKRSMKFQFVYTGPYTILRRTGPVNYLIRKNAKSLPFIAHTDKLKPCVDFVSLVKCYDTKPECNNSENVFVSYRKNKTMNTGGKVKKTYTCEQCGKISDGYRPHKQHVYRHRMLAKKEAALLEGWILDPCDKSSGKEVMIEDREMIEIIEPEFEATVFLTEKELEVVQQMNSVDERVDDILTGHEISEIFNINDKTDYQLEKGEIVDKERRDAKLQRENAELRVRLQKMEDQLREVLDKQDQDRRKERGKTPMLKGKTFQETVSKKKREDRCDQCHKKLIIEIKQLTEKKRIDAEKMIDLLMRIFRELPETTPMEQLQSIARARFAEAGPELPLFVYALKTGINNGKETVIETRTKEINNHTIYVKPICLVVDAETMGVKNDETDEQREARLKTWNAERKRKMEEQTAELWRQYYERQEEERHRNEGNEDGSDRTTDEPYDWEGDEGEESDAYNPNDYVLVDDIGSEDESLI